MRRREALATGGGLLAGVSAGCLESLRREDAWRELVVDPPDGVYVPSHADEMLSYGTTTAAGREISIGATRPHSFWTVTDEELSRSDVRSRHALHLMVDVRDGETGTVVPAPVTTTLRRGSDGERVDRRDLWPMLSQRMGVHYGDNVPIEDGGTYTVTVRVGPTSADVNTTETPAGKLAEPTTVGLEFEYEPAAIEGLERRLIDEDEDRGDPAALEPMGCCGDGRDEPAFDGPDAVRIGSGTTGDVVFVAALFGGADRSGRESPVLAVALLTPHNRYPLPFAAVSADVFRENDRIATGSPRETIDPRHGHRYGTRVEPDVLERGDELAISLDTPPQVARHEGYETAFLEGETTLSLAKREA
ncbi:iron transporter [Natrarchaeobius chitinivorans]|uniref:DUF7350 domain-containing protein n=1 Tax=Natrarchaeobius chitinivorans TaxID=1679083 RepID=A0A3N6LZJ1_NATCH|nr:iron transporter [Natrarchaeobius chitinivorans]RQG93354.1 hypothetical protein EA473_15085 [Natrarchaeobius chitinivorans]